MENETMVDAVTTIMMEVIRILTFQYGRGAPHRHRKAVVNPSDTDRVR
jgi:hypothetical protein